MTFGQGVANYLVNSSQAVAQIIQTVLGLWKGEWFLALNAGVPWSTQVLGRNAAPLAVMVIRTAILNCPGVVSLGNLSFSYDANARIVSVIITNLQTQFSANDGIIPQVTIPIPFAA
jgi:hypothetical protein